MPIFVAYLLKKICFIDLEITFLLSVMRNLAHLALAGNRRSVSTSTLYIYLLYISMGVELLLIIIRLDGLTRASGIG